MPNLPGETDAVEISADAPHPPLRRLPACALALAATGLLGGSLSLPARDSPIDPGAMPYAPIDPPIVLIAASGDVAEGGKGESDDDLLSDSSEDDLLSDSPERPDGDRVIGSEETAPPESARDAHGALLLESRYPSANTCATCHPRHYAEWSVSQHAYAQLSPVYLAM